MSMKRMLLAAGGVVILLAPATDASAQYHYYDRQRVDRLRYDRPVAATRSVAKPKTQVMAARTTGPAGTKPADQASKPAPAPVPLSPEELAAKAAVDELMAREPALAAAKALPDPRLAKAAAAKHDAEEKRRAALQAKEPAAIVQRKEIADKLKTREEAKVAARKTMPLATPSNSKIASVDLRMAAPNSKKPAASTPGAAAPQPALRMPAPEPLPVANLRP